MPSTAKDVRLYATFLVLTLSSPGLTVNGLFRHCDDNDGRSDRGSISEWFGISLRWALRFARRLELRRIAATFRGSSGHLNLRKTIRETFETVIHAQLRSWKIECTRFTESR